VKKVLKGLEQMHEKVTDRKVTEIQIRPWEESDLDLLFLVNAPEMMEHLGGPESEEQIFARHKRYLELEPKGKMFSIQLLPYSESVGSVGYWESVWQDTPIYEIGWSVLTDYQGKGIAKLAVKAAIADAREQKKYDFIHAFPSVYNPASNAICRNLGFELVSECRFEYPPGNMMQCNNWRLALKDKG
jgi:RimJ/RimL family protein N-acetyltransferase